MSSLTPAAARSAEATEFNALGEPMPASEAEALARQLVGELSEMQTLPGCYDQTRYDAKSAQVRALGFEIGPDGRGGLVLWHADNSGPLYLPATRLPDVTELDYDASIAFALAFEAAGLGSAELGLVELDELVILMAAARQIVVWWELQVLEPARAYRAELAADAERERVRLMLAELAGLYPSTRAYGRALEALDDGAQWWTEGRALVIQRVRGSRHVLTAEGCGCEAATWGRRCWASALGEALGRLDRRRLAA
jgi:hypothetical protein